MKNYPRAKKKKIHDVFNFGVGTWNNENNIGFIFTAENKDLTFFWIYSKSVDVEKHMECYS
jgi:hypothetical protein